jgi:hypothetical protein
VFPDEEEPVVNSTRPDAPISPPFIVDVVIEPDVDVDPYPDLMKTDPPVSDPPIPAETEKAPPMLNSSPAP